MLTLSSLRLSKPARLTARGRWWRGSTLCTGCLPPPRRRRTIGSSASSESTQRVWSNRRHPLQQFFSFQFFCFCMVRRLTGRAYKWPSYCKILSVQFVTSNFSKEQSLCNNLAKSILVGRLNIYLAEGIYSRASISTNPFYNMMSQR